MIAVLNLPQATYAETLLRTLGMRFDQMDTDHKGYIQGSQLAEFFSAEGTKVDPSAIKKLKSKLGLDGDQKITKE